MSFRLREKSNCQGIALRLLNLRWAEAGSRGSDLVFVAQVDGADAWIVGVERYQQPTFQKEMSGVAGIVRYGARLYIAGQAGLDADAMLGHMVHKGGILGRRDGVPDALGAQLAESLPDAVWTGRFACMNGDLPADVSCLMEVLGEQLAGPIGFVSGQIQGDQAIAPGQERL